MITLQKFLYIAIIATLPIHSFGKTDYIIGRDGGCLAIDRPWPDGNSVYFCGHIDEKTCGDVKYGNTKHELNSGKSMKFNDATYWCCGGNESKLGKFKQGTNWNQSETITEQLPNGGTCTWTRTKTICDDDWRGTKCTTAECPNAGEIFRNGECVKPCEAPSVFASPTSNTCITCEENTWRGLGVDDNYNPTCISCNPDTELYIKSREKCVAKSSLKQYTMNDMNKCWRCNGTDNFKACLNGKKPHKFCPEDYNGEK